MPPADGHQAADDAAQQRRAAPRQLAVVGQRLGEAHRNAGAERGRDADQERVPGVAGGEGGGEHRRQRRHRAVHQADQAGLDDLQDEAAARVLVLVVARVGGEDRFFEIGGEVLVLDLGLGEVAEQLADRRVARALDGEAIEALGVVLHLGGAVAHRVDAERAELPDRLARRCSRLMSWRRISGMCSPNLATNRSISRRRCSFSSAAMSLNILALEG